MGSIPASSSPQKGFLVSQTPFVETEVLLAALHYLDGGGREAEEQVLKLLAEMNQHERRTLRSAMRHVISEIEVMNRGI